MRGANLSIRLKDRQVRFDGRDVVLSRRFFELYCLLALQRRTAPTKQGGFVDPEQIVQLPSWTKNSVLSVGKQIRRQMQKTQRQGLNLIEAQQKVKGPFRLSLPANRVHLDVTDDKLISSLGLSRSVSRLSATDQGRFYDFADRAWRADLALNDGKLARAKEYWRLASEIAVLPHHRILAVSNLVRILERLGDYEEALRVFKDCLGSLRKVKEDVDWAEAKLLVAGAWLHRRTGNRPQAEKMFRKALAIAKGHREHRLLGDIYNGLGLLHQDRGQWHEALRLYDAGLESFVLAGASYGMQGIYYNIGRTYGLLGNQFWDAGYKEQARDYYRLAVGWVQQCMTLAQRLEIADDTSDDNVFLAYLYRKLGKLQRAVEAASQANRNAERAGNQRCMALSYNQMAKAYALRGETDQVMAILKECKEKVRRRFMRLVDEGEILEILSQRTKGQRTERATPPMLVSDSKPKRENS